MAERAGRDESLPTPGVTSRHWVASLLGLLAVALNLRIALASVPPLLPAVQQSLGIGHGPAGLLSTIPVACMGLFAPASVRLAGRFGIERTILLGTALLALTTAGRGIGGGLGLYVGTFGVGVSLALAGTVLNQFVKDRFSQHAVVVNGLYSASLGAGAALGASATVPIVARTGGSWQWGLAVWSILAVFALVLWALLVGTRDRGETVLRIAHLPLPWRSRKAWVISLIFAFQSCIYYAALTWIPPLYVSAGWNAGRAGLLLSVLSLAQIVAALVVPAIAHRMSDHRPTLILAAAVTGGSLLALALVPDVAPWIWSVALGLGAGALFPLALTLPLDAADSPAEAGSLVAMSSGLGYALAALAPFAVGVIRDLSGGFRLPFLLLTVLAIVLMGIATQVPSRRPH